MTSCIYIQMTSLKDVNHICKRFYLSIFISVRERERKGDRDKESPIHWFLFPMSVLARSGLGWIQALRAQDRCPVWLYGTHYLSHHLLPHSLCVLCISNKLDLGAELGLQARNVYRTRVPSVILMIAQGTHPTYKYLLPWKYFSLPPLLYLFFIEATSKIHEIRNTH